MEYQKSIVFEHGKFHLEFSNKNETIVHASNWFEVESKESAHEQRYNTKYTICFFCF